MNGNPLPKTQVFGVCYWENEKPAYLEDWYARINKFLPNQGVYLCPGCWSDPKLCPIPVPVIQYGLKKSEDYSRNWCYYYSGFMTGIYHALLNLDFELLVHVQDRTLIGIDLTDIIQEFMERDEILCAPKYTGQIGVGIETGFMMMKKEAVMRYATSNMRCALSEYDQINVEDEALYMFDDDWWNPFPSIHTIREFDGTFVFKKTPFNLSQKKTINLPILAAGKHSLKREQVLWQQKHPL